MATIYLFRHGQASFGADDYDKLSPLGERQATVLGEYLRDTGVVLDAVYSGDLSRQRETARLALLAQPSTVEPVIDDRFNEIDNDEQVKAILPRLVKTDARLAAIVERGLSSSKDYQKVIDAVFNYWVSPECDEPGIRSWSDYSGAVKSAMRELITTQGSGKTTGIFTSGGTIATIVAQVLGLAGYQTYQFYEPVFNCSVTQLFYSGNKISLSYFNDRSYLQLFGAKTGEELVTYR
ncbi:MAG: histidine phosphatase family protein [Pseudomonadota bacterium]